MIKRCLIFVATALVVLSLAACDAAKNDADAVPTESGSANVESIDTLAGKTPLEAYRAAQTYFETIDNYEMIMISDAHIVYGDSAMDAATKTVFKINGEQVYYSYAEDGDTLTEHRYVDNALFYSSTNTKEQREMTFEEYKDEFGMPTGDSILLPLPDEAFENLKFEVSDDGYLLNFEISEEDYLEYSRMEVSEPAHYVVYFDSNAAFKGVHTSMSQIMFEVVSVNSEIDVAINNVGTTAQISVPDDADQYRIPPEFLKIDMSDIDSLDGVALSGGPTDYVMMEIENFGTIVVRLFPDVAPKTVENFKRLVAEGFYDGLIFHRVIKDFMIQGGSPTGEGTGVTEDKIVGEFSQNGITNNLLHKRGVVSMARSNDFDSASCQFFIMHRDAEHLNGSYAAFGYVIYGMDTVDAIAELDTDANNKPVNDVVISSVRFVTVS